MLPGMVTAETVRLLRWHAGLEGDALDGASVSGATAVAGAVAAAVADCLRVLGSLNVELNGPHPSGHTSLRADAVPRGAAYAVSEVSRMLRAAGRDDAAWQVDTAWNAVLAGDVDDVAKHVAGEQRARD
jgi:hypothetical protein